MKIYFAGAIRGGRDKVKDYAKMVKHFEELGEEVLTKHVADPNLSVNGENMTANEIYKRDIEWLKQSDIIFADITVASLGVGYELAYAENLGKTIYAVYEKNANVSALIRGNEKINFLTYDNIEEVIKFIDEIICENNKIM